MINNNLMDLEHNFRLKVFAFLSEALVKFPNLKVFETTRTKERQIQLLEQGKKGIFVTWTVNSLHIVGKAIDIVFDYDGVIKWEGPYQELHNIARKYGIVGISKELCHFQCDGTLFNNTEIMEVEKVEGFYKKMFINKYGKSSVINDIEGMVDKCSYDDGTVNIEEFIYAMLIKGQRELEYMRKELEKMFKEAK